MSSSSFLGQARRGHSNTTGRVFKELATKMQKLASKDVVIQDESLTDEGKITKGRVIVRDKIRYVKQLFTIPTYKLPEEPDGTYLRLWIKGNSTGLYLRDLSYVSTNHTIRSNHDKPLCMVDSGGFDVGYMGKYQGQQSSPVFKLHGTGQDSAYVEDAPDLTVEGTTTGISVAAWVKITDFSQLNGHSRRILAKSDDSNNAYTLFVNSQKKAIFSVKFNGVEYAVQTPADSLTLNQWHFIAGTFKSTSTEEEAKVYLDGTVSTALFSVESTEPAFVAYPSTSDSGLWLFCNGLTTVTDTENDGLQEIQDLGGFAGYVRDLRLWREKILTQQEITNFNTNKNTISNIALNEYPTAGYCYASSDALQSEESFTTTSFSSTSFNT